MTVIAIKKTKDQIEIAADNQTTIGLYNKMVNSKDKIFQDGNKISQVNGMVIAGAGYVKETNLLNIFAKNHKPKTPDEDGVLEFIIEFYEWANKKNVAKNKDDRLGVNQYLLVYESRIFEIVDCLLVREIKNYASIGSGMFLALGALYFEKSVEQAVEVAKEFDTFCGGKTQKITIPITQ